MLRSLPDLRSPPSPRFSLGNTGCWRKQLASAHAPRDHSHSRPSCSHIALRNDMLQHARSRCGKIQWPSGPRSIGQSNAHLLHGRVVLVKPWTNARLLFSKVQGPPIVTNCHTKTLTSTDLICALGPPFFPDPDRFPHSLLLIRHHSFVLLASMPPCGTAKAAKSLAEWVRYSRKDVHGLWWIALSTCGL